MSPRSQSRFLGVLAIIVAIAMFGFAQQPNTASPPQNPPEAQGGRGGRGGRAVRRSSFPVHAPAPPAVVARGRQLFEANCGFCHGSDARGGETGPNLIRAQVVLDDQHGELIGPIVHNGFPSQGMPKFDLSEADITAIVAFLHSAPLGNRGAPSNLDILVGNAQAGESYFSAHCTTCHSATGDLAGIGSKYDPKEIQNLVVSGGGGRRGFGRGGPTPPKVPPTTVTVTLPSGQSYTGTLDHISAFVVSLKEADGTHRTFTRNGSVPKVVVKNPLQWHIDMLPKWNDSDIHNLAAYLVTLK